MVAVLALVLSATAPPVAAQAMSRARLSEGANPTPGLRALWNLDTGG